MDAFEAIADPTRRALIERLGRGPARVVDLAAEHPVSRPAISRHLRVLGEAGVVTAVDHGRERHYELVPEGLGVVRDWLDALSAGAARPPFSGHHLDALGLEVRRTMRERADSTDEQPDDQKETG